ncbi:hypothetical protein TeGR_g9538 [Tetraparma gracilis]|uniref:IMS import disulfide relay-system CHCH-CHCH-like Cx9C domain-containing protein n=1 Tax=Tetraparma gracilis TaxID=2962635 RepID=A0ABQ6NAT4_9STRA|nr:hypothetical protein TeGR_g9538 [Tetraparma gracilis]
MDASTAASEMLWAGSKFIGADCAGPNKAFYMCKQSSADPSACLSQGQAVTRCAGTALATLSGSCSAGFQAYRQCLEGNRRQFSACRDVQEQLQKCYDEAKKL